MSKHAQREPQVGNLGLLALAVIMLALIVSASVGVATTRTESQASEPEQTARLIAPEVLLSFDKPAVDATPAPQVVDKLAGHPPIPPCVRDFTGPGVPPCHWDSGQYGGGQSYVWTGEYKIILTEPKP